MADAILSRRVITYELPGLSFREFLALDGHGNFSSYKLEDIIQHHYEIATSILKQLQPLPLFKKYLKYGYLPLFHESSTDEIPVLLNQTINTIIETDLGYIKDYTSGTAFKVKKLLTNLAFALKPVPDIGSIRETFLLNQLINKGMEVTLPETGDFLTNDIHMKWKEKEKQPGR